MRIFLVFVLIYSFCFSRENPFLPAGDINSGVMTTNIIENLPPFEKQNIKFPSDTKEFISITLKYKNLDGSIKEKAVDINKSIDWQDEFVLMKLATPVVVAKPDVSVTKDEPKITIKPINIETNTTVITIAPPAQPAVERDINLTKQEPLKDVVITPIENVEKLPTKTVKFNKSSFEIDPMQIKILTPDVKIKDYPWSNDRKIVIDFKSSKNFYTKSFGIDCGAFKSVTFGAHDSFYRAVIDLDGRYKYTLENIDGGYLLKVSKR